MKKIFKVLGIIFGSIVCLGFILYVTGFIFCYKFINVTNDEYKAITNRIHIKDDVSIKSKKVSNYVILGDVKFRDDFSKFKRVSYDVDDDGFVSASYKYKDKVGKRFIYFDFNSMKDDDSYNPNSDEIKYVKNAKLKSINFNVMNIISNSELYLDAGNYLDDEITEYSYITGDYKGYIKNNYYTKYKIVILYNNGKAYEFDFDGHGYFSDKYIYDFISTVVFLQTNWSFFYKKKVYIYSLFFVYTFLINF